jgi:RHS repeat-associated protein
VSPLRQLIGAVLMVIYSFTLLSPNYPLPVWTDNNGREVLRVNGDNTKQLRAYDAGGNLVAAMDELGRQNILAYDGLNRVTRQTEPGGAVTNLVYDAAGNLKERQMPGGLTWKATYDNYSRQTGEQLMNGSSSSRQFGFAYYSSGANQGRLQSVTDPNGQVHSYTYDAFGRVQGGSVAASGSLPGTVTQETFASGTLGYQFDNNTVNGLGVRTRAASGGYEFKATAQDAFSRPTGEREIGAAKTFTAHGNALGAATVDVAVDGHNVSAVNFAGADGDGNWSASLALPPGAHTLTATAHHPSGQFSPNAQSQFTVTSGTVAVNTAYNAKGQVTGRTFGDGRTQTLGWDGLGRLVTVSERDSDNNGYNWNAVYDAYGRRLRTVWTPVAGNTADNSKTLTTDSIYDPQVEFLEIGVKVNGQQNWKVYGPDLNGAYGGLQGIGGLEASTDADGQTSGILNDYFGNSAAWSPAAGTVTWNDTTVGGYGALPGKAARPLTATTSLADATVWKGKRIDPTGFYYLGARYYEPNSGRFISPDPIGHAASKALYDYANGDPVNNCDPDGRFGKNAVISRWEDLKSFGNYSISLNGLPYLASGNLYSLFNSWQLENSIIEYTHNLEIYESHYAAADATFNPAMSLGLHGFEVAGGLGLTYGNIGRELTDQEIFNSLIYTSLDTVNLAASAFAGAKLTLGGAKYFPSKIKLTDDSFFQSVKKGKGNFGLGTASYAEAMRLGKAWVGEGYRIASDGKTLVSKDGLRQFRPPTFKPKQNKIQANFEQRMQPRGEWLDNGHLDIIE